MVSFVHKQNIICSQTQLDDIIGHQQPIICRQLFAISLFQWIPLKNKRVPKILVALIFFVWEHRIYCASLCVPMDVIFVVRPIRNATQIWVMTRHQYEVSVVVP